MKTRNMWIVLLLTALALVLSACSTSGETPAPAPEVATLTYGVLSPDSVDREAIDDFNRSHTDVQIEVAPYYTDDGSGKSGKDRLITEILSGKCPDILDLGVYWCAEGQLPYRQLAEKGYLEDLWPYIESDPDLGRDGVMEAPLKAAEIDGGLYAVFDGVSINTLAAPAGLVGDRYTWTLADIEEIFETMPEGSSILPDCYTKQAVFDYMLGMDLESYVDWETGQCAFDGERFRTALVFCDTFPLEYDWDAVDGEEANLEWNTQLLSGQQLLCPAPVMHAQDIQTFDAIMGGRAAFIGYPMADGSVGSSFTPSNTRLAMSSGCQDKEAAWEFIRQLLLPRASGKTQSFAYTLPINRKDFNAWCKEPVDTETPYAFPPVMIDLHRVTEEELDRFTDFYNSIEKIDLWDSAIYDIVRDVCGPYFAGDRDLDATIDLIQRRVSLYVNELR